MFFFFIHLLDTCLCLYILCVAVMAAYSSVLFLFICESLLVNWILKPIMAYVIINIVGFSPNISLLFFCFYILSFLIFWGNILVFHFNYYLTLLICMCVCFVLFVVVPLWIIVYIPHFLHSTYNFF